MSKRGVVISPLICAAGDGSVSIPTTEIDADDLRYYLTYWDELDWPEIGLVKLGADDADIRFLRDIGILHRTRVNVPSWAADTPSLFAGAQAEVFKLHNENEPGIWTIAQPAQQLWLPDVVTDERLTVQIELYNAVPTPRHDVPLLDILEFKHKRYSELIAFRNYMDELYLSVVNSSDIPRARELAMDKIERSVLDLHKVMYESGIQSFLANVKIDLNLAKFGLLAFSTASLAIQFNLNPLLSIVGSGLVSFLKFERKLVPFARSLPAELKDYAYVFHIDRELR